MSNRLSFIFLMLLGLLAAACDKDDTTPDAEFYIEAKINGVLQRCTLLPNGGATSNEPLFPPMLTQANVMMIMTSAEDNTTFWNVGFSGVEHPDTWVLPKVFPGVSFLPQLDFSMVTFVPLQGTAVLNCQVNDDFRLVLNRIDGRILEGTFEGSAVEEDQCNANPTNTVMISEGRFRVRL